MIQDPADHRRVARDRSRLAKDVTCCWATGLELGLLSPVRSAAHKDIGRTRVNSIVVIRMCSKRSRVEILRAQH